jgi:hypothetical protein
MQGASIPTWMAYKRHLVVLPTYDLASKYYQQFRIPRPPGQDDAGSMPGMLCWGATGSMPSAEPLPTAGFNVEKNKEKSRKTEEVRIENPDDPTQYVIANRPTEIVFSKMINVAPSAPNTSSAKPSGVSEVGNPAQMKPAGGGASAQGGTVTFEYAKDPEME